MVSNLKTILKINYKLFSIKPILFIGYFIMILIWTVSPFITSYIIGNMFDILEKEMMRDYYFLTIVLFGINMFSIYIMKKAGIIDALISFFVSKSIKENIVKQLVKSDKNINIGEILDIISYDIGIYVADTVRIAESVLICNKFNNCIDIYKLHDNHVYNNTFNHCKCIVLDVV